MNRAWKKVAILKELASLDITLTQAATLMDIEIASVHYLKRTYGIEMKKGSNRPININHIRDRVLREYGKEGVTTAILAERFGSTKTSIRSTVCRLRKEGLLPTVAA